MMGPAILAIGGLVIALLAGRATPPSTEVVLLPQADGSPSSVVVVSGTARQTLSIPYQRAMVVRGQEPTQDTLDLATVQQAYPALFSAMPPPPEHFILYFEAGGTLLTPASQADLAKVVAAAHQRAGADILVIGHTDAQGDDAANDALSLQRAQQVRQMLLQDPQSVQAELIEARGRGKRQLAVPTADGVAEARNRRVEIFLR
ncbi:MAG: OmpA family protein [Rhodoferax sp.]|uniref:OmpA family protein n=1 Tax=Rhodoferax sp. TaxID=50421 RepID=UPI0032666CFC